MYEECCKKRQYHVNNKILVNSISVHKNNRGFKLVTYILIRKLIYIKYK